MKRNEMDVRVKALLAEKNGVLQQLQVLQLENNELKSAQGATSLDNGALEARSKHLQSMWEKAQQDVRNLRQEKELLELKESSSVAEIEELQGRLARALESGRKSSIL